MHCSRTMDLLLLSLMMKLSYSTKTWRTRVVTSIIQWRCKTPKPVTWMFLSASHRTTSSACGTKGGRIYKTNYPRESPKSGNINNNNNKQQQQQQHTKQTTNARTQNQVTSTKTTTTTNSCNKQQQQNHIKNKLPKREHKIKSRQQKQQQQQHQQTHTKQTAIIFAFVDIFFLLGKYTQWRILGMFSSVVVRPVRRREMFWKYKIS